MIARFLDVLEDTVKNLTWRPAELQAIDAPPALDYRTPDYTANAAKCMDLYGTKRRAEAKYAEALERAEQARRNVAVVLEKTSPATLAAAAIRTTLKKGGLLLGYNPRAPGSRLKARARTSSRPSAS